MLSQQAIGQYEAVIGSLQTMAAQVTADGMPIVGGELARAAAVMSGLLQVAVANHNIIAETNEVLEAANNGAVASRLS